MPILPRKGILAIAAVVDIALHDGDTPVSAKTLAVRHGLPPRHLEPVLQALVRDGILKGIRGPGGGYELAGEPGDITAAQILRAADMIDGEGQSPQSNSPLLAEVARVLAPCGLFAFTVESHTGEGVMLGEGLRYSYAESTVRALIAAAGLRLDRLESASSRTESGAQVAGLVVVAAKT